MKSFFSKFLTDKNKKIAAIVAAVITIGYSLFFYFSNCFNSAASKRINFYYAAIFITMIAMVGFLLYIILKDKEWNYPRLFVILALGWTISMQLVMPPISGVDEVDSGKYT